MAPDQPRFDDELAHLDERLRAVFAVDQVGTKARIWNRVAARIATRSSLEPRQWKPSLLGSAAVLAAGMVVVLSGVAVRTGLLHVGGKGQGVLASAHVYLRSMPEGTVVLDWLPGSTAGSLATKMTGLTPGSKQSLVFHQAGCSSPGQTTGVAIGNVNSGGGLAIEQNLLSFANVLTPPGSVEIYNQSAVQTAVACASFAQPHVVGSGTLETQAVFHGAGQNASDAADVVLMSDNSLRATLTDTQLRLGVAYRAEVHEGACPVPGPIVGEAATLSIGKSGPIQVRWNPSTSFLGALRAGSYLGLHLGQHLIACGDIKLVTESTPLPSVARPAAGWLQEHSALSPSAREGAAMGYNPTTRQVLLFGGTNSCTGCGGAPTILGDTWTWNGSWTRLLPTNSPAARTGAAMAYDATKGVLVLFGGASNNGDALGDTWIWNGQSWQEQSPTLSPSPRMGASVAWDGATHQLVLFGGYTPSVTQPRTLDDTWAWNGSTWLNLKPSVSPPARSYASLANEALGGTLVLFGGSSSPGDFLDDTWTWDGNSWTQQKASTHPASKSDAAITYDSRTGSVILFGGNGCTMSCIGTDNEMWSWKGGAWTRLEPISSPPGRFDASIAYDEFRHEVVLFGGRSTTNTFADTWVWAGQAP